MTAPSVEAPGEVGTGRPPEQEQREHLHSAAEAHRVSHCTAEKNFATWRARLALAGYTLARTDRQDGPPTYLATRWGMVRELADLDAVASFARQVGAT